LVGGDGLEPPTLSV